MERDSLALRRPLVHSGEVRVRRTLRWVRCHAELRGDALVVDGSAYDVLSVREVHSRELRIKTNTSKNQLLRLRTSQASEWASALRRATGGKQAVLSDYTQIAELGAGGGGRVTLVRRHRDGLQLALKTVQKTDAFRNSGALRHALDERLALELTRGLPFVLRLESAFQDTEALYHVTEYCGGGDLRGLLHRTPGGRLDESLARSLLSQIVVALGALHARGVMYRDLKPANVLLTGTGSVRLCDFGLAKVGLVHGRALSFCGTPGYMAPEILSRQWYGESVDMFALGVTAYAMLVGRAPFEAADENDAHALVRTQKPQIPSFLSESARELLQGLLAKNTNSRWTLGDVEECDFFKDIDWDDLGAHGAREHMENRVEVHDPALFEKVRIKHSNKNGSMSRPDAVLVAAENVVGYAFDARDANAVSSDNTDESPTPNVSVYTPLKEPPSFSSFASFRFRRRRKSEDLYSERY